MKDPKLTAERMGRISVEEYAKAPSSGTVIVLDNGRISDIGTHDELLALKGNYYRLYTGATELE